MQEMKSAWIGCMKKLFAALLFGLLVAGTQAQNSGAGIEGIVTDTQNQPLPFVSVVIAESLNGSATGVDGRFVIDDVQPGKHILQIKNLGYKDNEVIVDVIEGKTSEVKIVLQESSVDLQEVVVAGKSKVRQAKEMAYAINSVNVESLHNSNQDLNLVLSKTTGLIVREEGGLGSGFDFAINGLSGNQVKFFVDGIPLVSAGTSLTFNNIPVNLIDRAEVYKGVVPVHLGSDALGGAVNIITKESIRNFIDASYSFGSFNTHRVALNANYYNQSNGLTFNARGFYNYSDNDYKVEVQVVDPESGTYGEPQDLPRFHDAYESRMIQVEGGFRQRNWTDLFLVGATLSDNHNEIQHGVSMDRPYGEVFREDEVLSPFLKYKKDDLFIDGLDVKSYLSYTDGQFLVADTSSRRYNWRGEYQLNNDENIGEASWQKTLFRFNDKTLIGNAGIRYQFKTTQHIDFNYTLSLVNRKGSDPISRYETAFSQPNKLNKSIYGLSYTGKFFNEKLRTTLFAKFYDFHSHMIDVDWSGERTNYSSDYNNTGYGAAVTWFFSETAQLKTSVEKAYRLPEGYEMFGDGLNLLSNPALEPEKSLNANFGINWSYREGIHLLETEANLFYRDAKDFIRNQAEGATSRYVNQRDVLSSGVEAQIRYTWMRNYFISINGTFQNILNNTEFEGQRKSNVYLDRIPNIPYLFGNLALGAEFFSVLCDHDRISGQLNSRFVEEYFLKWPSQGDPERKYVIPRQISHNAEMTYSLHDGKYNVAFEVRNLLDGKLYDHFRLQKPGRSFYVKLRCYISK
ncbi:TonB-dependent receptor [Marinilabilia rubra]|nr:TonB-dependent receptor [Marinilabilia rubra]